MGKVIAVVSGKGGVGKSTIAAYLSECLSTRGRRVLAVDCDFGFRNLDMLLGLQNETVYDLSDVLKGAPPEKCIIQRRGEGSLSFLASYSDLDFRPEPQAFQQLVTELQRRYDYVILDAGAGLGLSFSLCVAVCQTALLVTTPDRTALRDAEKVSYLISSVERECGLIVNRVQPAMIRKNCAPDIDSMIDYVGVRLMGLLPEDRRLFAFQSAGLPMAQQKRRDFTRSLEGIALRVDGISTPLYRFW